MSVSFAPTPKSTSEIHLALVAQLQHSWLKREVTACNSASAAVSDRGIHLSGILESRTHLLDVTSEHAALALAISRKDPHIHEMVTVIDGIFELNPLVVKILVDHARRSMTTLSYRVLNKTGSELYFCPDISHLFYSPEPMPLAKISTWMPEQNWIAVDSLQPLSPQLRRAALLGMHTHFSSNTKTSYGAAVVAGDRIYYGGVYSSFDKRLNLHAEMVAALAAIADGRRMISHVGVISDKSIREPAHLCGCCRQFLIEIQQKTTMSIHIFAFSLDESVLFESPLAEYLPHCWDSGLSLEERKNL